MTVCLYGRGADLDKVNKYLSFSPFDIILISEYVDDMNFRTVNAIILPNRRLRIQNR